MIEDLLHKTRVPLSMVAIQLGNCTRLGFDGRGFAVMCTYLVTYVAVLQVCLVEAENEFVRHSVKKILIALSDHLIFKAQACVFCYIRKRVSLRLSFLLRALFSFTRPLL